MAMPNAVKPHQLNPRLPLRVVFFCEGGVTAADVAKGVAKALEEIQVSRGIRRPISIVHSGVNFHPRPALALSGSSAENLGHQVDFRGNEIFVALVPPAQFKEQLRLLLGRGTVVFYDPKIDTKSERETHKKIAEALIEGGLPHTFESHTL